MNDNERIAGWRGWIRRTTWPSFLGIRFDTDITLWHGDDGILKEIVRRKRVWEFAVQLADVLNCPHDTREEWYLVAGARATPAQLTAALVAMIKESE